MAPFVKLYGGKRKHSKQVIKFLEGNTRHPETSAAVLRDAPATVIKGLANLAYNIACNRELKQKLSRRQRKLFREHRAFIGVLIDPKTSVEEKRTRITSQKGGFAFLPSLAIALPAILKAGLNLLGPAILGGVASGIASRNQKPDEE